MKNSMVTELIKFKVLDTTTDDELISKADIMIHDFQKKQDGFIDAELVKGVEEDTWYFIYHYENLEKLKAVAEKIRKNKGFKEFTPVIIPDSVDVTFYYHIKKW